MPAVPPLPSLLATAAFLPPLFYLWAVASFDRRTEPAAVVVGTFVLGAAGAVMLNSLIAPVADTAVAGLGPLLDTCTRTFLVVSVPEEAAKFAILIIVARPFIARDNPMSGVVYGAAVGFGFAAAENVGYLLLHADRWTSVAFVRSVVTVPVHGVLGIIAGVYVARGRAAAALVRRRAARRRMVSYAAALLIPVVLHAVYDFPFALTRACEDPAGQAVTLLKALGLAAGLGITAIGMSITFRMAATQDPDFEPHCLSPYLLKAPWRIFVLGSLCATLGFTVIAAELLAVLHGATPTTGRWLMLTFGLALLVLTALLHRLGMRKRRQTKVHDR